jgi:hypothetical protein
MYAVLQAIEALDDPRLHVALCVAAKDLGRTFVELRAGFSADKTASAAYPMLKNLVGESNSYGTVTDVHKELRSAREKLTACLSPDSNSHITDEMIDRHGCDILESIPKIRRNHPILRIVPETFWRAHNFELWCEGWIGGSDKRRKSVIASLGWAMLGRYLQEEVVPKVMQEGGMIRWLLHFARDLRAITKQPPAWWENHSCFNDTIPELKASTSLSQASGGSDPSSNVPAGTGHSEHQCATATRKTKLPGSVSLSASALSPGRAAQQHATPQSKTRSTAAALVTPPKPSTPAPTFQLGQSDKTSHVASQPGPMSRRIIEGDKDKLANEDNNKVKDIVLPMNPSDSSVGPGEPDDTSEQDDLIGEPEQLNSGQSDDMVDAFELIRRFAPDHVLGLCKVSPRYPQHFWGMQLSQRGEPDCPVTGNTPEKQDNLLVLLARQNAESALSVLPLIKEERENLRRSVFSVTQVMAQVPYASDLAVTTLIPTILSFRVSPFPEVSLTICFNGLSTAFLAYHVLAPGLVCCACCEDLTPPLPDQ